MLFVDSSIIAAVITEVRSMVPLFYNKPSITWDCVKVLLDNDCLVGLAAPCLEHGGHCVLPEGDENISGLPCPQWSSQHPCPRDLADAECALVTACWIGLRRKIQEKRVTYENASILPTFGITGITQLGPVES